MAMTQCIRSELDLIERLSGTYARQFQALIDELNRDPAAVAGGRAVRACVEAVHLLLVNQQHLADALRKIADREHAAPPPLRLAVAAA